MKLALAAGTATVAVIMVIGGAVQGAVNLIFGDNASQPSEHAVQDIPNGYLRLYQAASRLCPGLDWTILAAVGKIETDHGRSTLPGVTSGENAYQAAGPMQFLPGTFAEVLTRHHLPAGGASPPSRYNPHDAIHAAAFYLCDNGARDQRNLRDALFAYNHADWYVNQVLTQAAEYRAIPALGAPDEIRLDWPPDQATIPDPTSGGLITPRTYTLLLALRANGMTGDGIGCFAHRPANPDSDHPKGRACDIMFNPHNQRSVAEGWVAASWLIANQARYGITYLIWQGQYWSARDPRWVPYVSSNYGCPNPANLTGCHYDHIHWSVA